MRLEDGRQFDLRGSRKCRERRKPPTAILDHGPRAPLAATEALELDMHAVDLISRGTDLACDAVHAGQRERIVRAREELLDTRKGVLGELGLLKRLQDG